MVTTTNDKGRPTCYGQYPAGGEACNDCPTQLKLDCLAASPAQ